MNIVIGLPIKIINDRSIEASTIEASKHQRSKHRSINDRSIEASTIEASKDVGPCFSTQQWMDHLDDRSSLQSTVKT
jgi:hypothetical protein